MNYADSKARLKYYKKRKLKVIIPNAIDSNILYKTVATTLRVIVRSLYYDERGS